MTGYSRDVLKLQPISQIDAPVLAQLFELYAYDFSEFMPLELKASGRFEIPVAEAWWSGAGRHPFFIHYYGKLAGFALVRRGSQVTGDEHVMDMAEFFVVRGARKKHIGQRVAHELLRMFPARWEIRIRQSNVAAASFWTRVAQAWPGAHTTTTFETTDGASWNLIRVGPV